MMDEFDLLKKDWKKQGENLPKLKQSDIYPMLLKKSSSIVKWIFIISILEFVFWTVISFFSSDEEALERLNSYDVNYIWHIISVIGYLVLAYFFYRFYKNYKTISATDNAKMLMENILKTRRTVKQYVGFNLIYLTVTVIIITGIIYANEGQTSIFEAENVSANGEFFIVLASLTIVLVAVIALLLLFYWLIYGLLLNRLNKNYKELKKMEL